jgi:hypothetical protein
MGEGRVAGRPAGVSGPGTGESEARRFQRADANPWWPDQNWFLELLVLGVDHRRIHPESAGGLRSLPPGPEPAIQSANSSQAVEPRCDSVLSRGASASLFGRVAKSTASRLSGSALEGAGGSDFLEKSAEIIIKGYSEPRLSSLDSNTRRFMKFEANGFERQESGIHKELAWISYQFQSQNHWGDRGTIRDQGECVL